MTLIVTILTAMLAGVSGIFQYLEKIEDANEKTKMAIANERKQKEISDIQKELIDRSNELRAKTNDLLKLNSKLQESNELVIKLQSDQKLETQRLQSPITDKFRVSFQIWFFSKKYSDILDKVLNKNAKPTFYSLFPFEMSNCNINEVNEAVDDLVKRIDKSGISVNFENSKLKFQPLALLGQIDLHDHEFLTAKSEYNYDETSTSPYRFNYWLTYNKDDKFFRLNIQSLPLRIILQHYSIVSLRDLNGMAVKISTINIVDFNNYNNITPLFKLEKVELHWLHFLCGSRVLSPIIEPVYDLANKCYLIDKIKIDE